MNSDTPDSSTMTQVESSTTGFNDEYSNDMSINTNGSLPSVLRHHGVSMKKKTNKRKVNQDCSPSRLLHSLSQRNDTKSKMNRYDGI